jgi:hypothetical protein
VTRGRWRFAAGLALIAVAGVIALLGGRSGGGPRLSDDARRYPADERKVFVRQVRTADGEHELADVKDVELVNRGAAYCAQLAKTGSSLKAVFALQLAGQTHPGDVYVTATARRVLCPNLPDSDPRPSPG